jgi:lipopolysaccharide O-acetyltransferase
MNVISIEKLLYYYSIPRLIKNKILNKLVNFLTKKKLYVDWTGIKLIHPKSISIGNNFSCGRNIWIESVNGKGKISIGNNVNISDFVHIGSSTSVTIDDGVLIGSKVLITDHSHGLAKGKTTEYLINTRPNLRPIVSKGPVAIEKNVWIGDGACILSNVTIGEGAIIGANAVIVKNVPPFTVWGGIPAKLIYRLEK